MSIETCVRRALALEDEVHRLGVRRQGLILRATDSSCPDDDAWVELETLDAQIHRDQWRARIYRLGAQIRSEALGVVAR